MITAAPPTPSFSPIAGPGRMENLCVSICVHLWLLLRPFPSPPSQSPNGRLSLSQIRPISETSRHNPETSHLTPQTVPSYIKEYHPLPLPLPPTPASYSRSPIPQSRVHDK